MALRLKGDMDTHSSLAPNHRKDMIVIHQAAKFGHFGMIPQMNHNLRRDVAVRSLQSMPEFASL